MSGACKSKTCCENSMLHYGIQYPKLQCCIVKLQCQIVDNKDKVGNEYEKQKLYFGGNITL